MRVTYESADDLAQAMRRAAEAHGRYEAEIGREDADWPDWYSRFMEREQRFLHLPGRVDPAGTTAAHPAAPANGDPEQDFFLRYGAAGPEWDFSDD